MWAWKFDGSSSARGTLIKWKGVTESGRKFDAILGSKKNSNHMQILRELARGVAEGVWMWLLALVTCGW